MRFSSIFVAAAAVTGLAGCRSEAIEDRANERLNQEYTTAVRNAVYPTCPDRAVIAGNCGLILKHASTEDFRMKFRDRKCVGIEDAACETLYQSMLDAWLVQRYVLADWRKVALTCNSDPGRCDDPVAYELLLVDSHNYRIRDDYAGAEKEIEAQRQEEQARHVRGQVAAVSAGLGVAAAVAGVRRAPRCRSYPSAFTGVSTTVCR